MPTADSSSSSTNRRATETRRSPGSLAEAREPARGAPGACCSRRRRAGPSFRVARTPAASRQRVSGRILRGAARPPGGGGTASAAGSIVLGSGAVPLLRGGRRARLVETASGGGRQALTNNRYSSDIAPSPTRGHSATSRHCPRTTPCRAGWRSAPASRSGAAGARAPGDRPRHAAGPGAALAGSGARPRR